MKKGRKVKLYSFSFPPGYKRIMRQIKMPTLDENIKNKPCFSKHDYDLYEERDCAHCKGLDWCI